MKTKQKAKTQNNFLRKVFVELGPVFGVPASVVRGLLDTSLEDAAAPIRDFDPYSPLAHVYTYHTVCNPNLFVRITETQVWAHFNKLLSQDIEAYLIFPIKGLKHWVLTLNVPRETVPGQLRAIVPSAGEEDAYLVPMDLFKKEYKDGDH